MLGIFCNDFYENREVLKLLKSYLIVHLSICSFILVACLSIPSLSRRTVRILLCYLNSGWGTFIHSRLCVSSRSGRVGRGQQVSLTSPGPPLRSAEASSLWLAGESNGPVSSFPSGAALPHCIGTPLPCYVRCTPGPLWSAASRLLTWSVETPCLSLGHPSKWVFTKDCPRQFTRTCPRHCDFLESGSTH